MLNSMPFSPKLVRIVRRLLISLAVFATLIALAVVVENWRGDRAWKRYAAEHAARGEILDALPEPTKLSPEVNFFKTPVIDRWIFDEKGKDFLRELSAPNVRSAGALIKGWRVGLAPDFKDVIETINRHQGKPPAKESSLSSAITPAGQLLELLTPLDSLMLELRQASKQRPGSQLVKPVLLGPELWTYWIGDLNYEFVHGMGTGLSLHASASLAEQKDEIAFEDVMACLKFSRGLTSAPNAKFIEILFGRMILEQSLQPIWQGLQHHAWSDEQLVEIQQELTRTDLFDPLDRAFRFERAMLLNAIDYMPPRKLVGDTWEKWIWQLIPRGWLQQNKIAYCVLSTPCHQILAARGKPDFLNQLSHAGKYPAGFDRFTSPYMRIASIFVKGTDKLPETIAPSQALLTLAQTACALERYRLAHGNYPGSLAELVPAYLDKVPIDIIDGQPLHYRRTDNGRFMLYSIGLDGKDDGGKSIDIKNPKILEGDWIWPQPVEN